MALPTVERTTPQDHSFQAAALGFTGVVLLAIGAVFFVHENTMRTQREIYSQYVAWNAWKAPAKAAGA